MSTRWSGIRNGVWVAVVSALCLAALTGCGSGGVDSGGLSAGDRKAAQATMDELQQSNVARQLVSITETLQAVPAACRVRLVSSDPSTFRVYVFWVPWLASQAYTWLDMTITRDAVSKGRFLLGTSKPVLPGGKLAPDGRSVNPFSLDTTLMTRYGPDQAKKSHQVLVTHAGNVYSKPSARCQVLTNGSLRLVPNP